MSSWSTLLAPQTWQGFMYHQICTVLHLRKNLITVNLTSILNVSLGYASSRKTTKFSLHPWLQAHLVHKYLGGRQVFGAHGWSKLTEPQTHPFLMLRLFLPICCHPTHIDVPSFSHTLKSHPTSPTMDCLWCPSQTSFSLLTTNSTTRLTLSRMAYAFSRDKNMTSLTQAPHSIILPAWWNWPVASSWTKTTGRIGRSRSISYWTGMTHRKCLAIQSLPITTMQYFI